ncbi:hypothetical protein QL285_046724 [Trifolium repens]|nr:hypothetical protein QL285_046724 [Trifolium repens]
MINYNQLSCPTTPKHGARHLYATSESAHRKEKKVVQPGTTKSCCSNNTALNTMIEFIIFVTKLKTIKYGSRLKCIVESIMYIKEKYASFEFT